MEIEYVGKEKEAVVAAVKGRVDAVTAPEFEKQFSRWIKEGNTCFLVGFEQLDYISSAGLRSILVIAKKLKGQSGRIVLYGLKDVVREVFKISGFDTIIPICGSFEEALEQFQASPPGA